MNNEKAFTPSDIVFAFQKGLIIFVAKEYLYIIKSGQNISSWKYKDIEKLLDNQFTRPSILHPFYDIPPEKDINELKTYITSLGFQYSKDLQKYLDKEAEDERKRIALKKLNQYGLGDIKGVVSTDFDEYSTLEIYKKNGEILDEDTESVRPEVVSLFRKLGWNDWFKDDLGLGNSFQKEWPALNLEELEELANQLRGIGLECEIDIDEEDLKLFGK